MGRVILETLQEIADGRPLVAALVDAGEERELIAGDATRFQDAYYVIELGCLTFVSSLATRVPSQVPAASAR